MTVVIGAAVRITTKRSNLFRPRKFDNKIGLIHYYDFYSCGVSFGKNTINFFIDEIEFISKNKYGSIVPVDNRFYKSCYWCETPNIWLFVRLKDTAQYCFYCPKCLR